LLYIDYPQFSVILNYSEAALHIELTTKQFRTKNSG